MGCPWIQGSHVCILGCTLNSHEVMGSTYRTACSWSLCRILEIHGQRDTQELSRWPGKPKAWKLESRWSNAPPLEKSSTGRWKHEMELHRWTLENVHRSRAAHVTNWKETINLMYWQHLQMSQFGITSSTHAKQILKASGLFHFLHSSWCFA